MSTTTTFDEAFRARTDYVLRRGNAIMRDLKEVEDGPPAWGSAAQRKIGEAVGVCEEMVAILEASGRSTSKDKEALARVRELARLARERGKS